MVFLRVLHVSGPLVRRVMMNLSAAIVMMIIGVPAAQSQISAELYDYVVQDVCVDGANVATTEDPAYCANRRNIEIAEKSPYILADFPHSNPEITYQGLNSFPVLGMNGDVLIMTYKSLQQNYNPNYQFSWVEGRDAFDLMNITDSSFTSFVRTFDPGCFDQIWSSNGQAHSMAVRAGGWINFPYFGTPSSWAVTSNTEHRTHHVQLSPSSSPPCTNGSSLGRTFWNQPAPYRFETDKVLWAIRSDHFASSNLSAARNALERFYFTKEYGFTRWEQWIPQQQCFQERGQWNEGCHPEWTTNLIANKCKIMNVSVTGIPGLDRWGNQNWVRVDCRDTTKFVALNTPQVMLAPAMANANGIYDIDYLASLNPPLGRWFAAGPESGHGSGYANGTGWEIPATGAYTNLTFGPYVDNLPVGHLNAMFELKIDNNSTNNDMVIDLEVYDLYSGQILASKTLTRMQFMAAGVLQKFALPFYHSGQGLIEFKVHVHGRSYVHHAGTQVLY